MAQPLKSLTFPGGRPWPAQGKWTYADYLRLPDDGRRYEVIRGALYVTAAPFFGHQFVIWRLSQTFGRFVDDKGLGIVLTAPFDVLLPNGIATPIQPDLVFLRTGNHPSFGDKNFQGIPDLVIEVESPTTRKRDRTVKQDAYREAGVPEYWRVEPLSRRVTVLVLDGDRTRYVEAGCYESGKTLRSAILPEFQVLVDSLFPPA